MHYVVTGFLVQYLYCMSSVFCNFWNNAVLVTVSKYWVLFLEQLEIRSSCIIYKCTTIYLFFEKKFIYLYNYLPFKTGTRYIHSLTCTNWFLKKIIIITKRSKVQTHMMQYTFHFLNILGA